MKTPTTRPSTSPSRLSSATNPQPSKRLTIAAVTAELRAIGVTIRHHDGEYRVNLKGGSPASEYFTDDLADALGTGRDMAKRGAVVRNLQDYSATCADCGAQKVTVTDEGLCVRCSSKKERARGANVEPRCITQPSNAATIPALIAKLKATFDGDSNDEEHDAAVELVDALEAQPSKTWTAPNATAFLKMSDSKGETVTAPCGCILEPYSDSDTTGDSGAAFYQCETHEQANGQSYSALVAKYGEQERHLSAAVEQMNTLAEYLKEAHDEIGTDHAGDGAEGCTYCDAIVDADRIAREAIGLDPRRLRYCKNCGRKDTPIDDDAQCLLCGSTDVEPNR